MRYIKVDRWKLIPVADHPYDPTLCDLCMRECPIAGAISLEKSPAPTARRARVRSGARELRRLWRAR